MVAMRAQADGGSASTPGSQTAMGADRSRILAGNAVAVRACADLPPLASQIAITAIFAVSLDLILGYAGLVSLGHAAYFGLGAYTAGLIAKAGWGEPFSGLLIAAATPGCSVISPASSSCASATSR